MSLPHALSADDETLTEPEQECAGRTAQSTPDRVRESQS